MGMLDRGNRRVSPDGIGNGHVANGVKGVWEGLLCLGTHVPDYGCGGRRSHCS